MKFRVFSQQSSNHTQSPVRIVEGKTNREVGWTNRYLDREYVRRLGEKTLRTYAYDLLHFVRWWASVHSCSDVQREDLTENNLIGLRPIPVRS
jgi:hypothetical protein